MTLGVVAEVTVPLGDLVLCCDDAQLADGVLIMKLLDEIFQNLLKVIYMRLFMLLWSCRSTL